MEFVIVIGIWMVGIICLMLSGLGLYLLWCEVARSLGQGGSSGSRRSDLCEAADHRVRRFERRARFGA